MSDPDALQKTGGDGAAVQPADFTPRSMQELQQFAETVSQSQMVPRKYQGSPQDVVVAVMHGMELGLPPLQALQSIAVINGQPSLYGDAALALVKRSGKEAWTQEWTEGEGQSFTAYCETKPVGAPQPTKQHFSWQEAQEAGLLSNSGPWQDYPRRMMQMRARSWCLRDAYPEVLSGLMLAQEAEAIPNDNGATVDPNGKMGHTETQQDTSDVTYREVYGFHVSERHAEQIEGKDEELAGLDGADLAAAITETRAAIEGASGAVVKATEAMLESHEERLEEQQAEEDAAGQAASGEEPAEEAEGDGTASTPDGEAHDEAFEDGADDDDLPF